MNKFFIKLTLLVSCIALLISVSAFAIEEPKAASDEIINTIKILEIANGDENGNMNYDKTVTRAEFVKMAVAASPDKDKAKNAVVSYSVFPDVKQSYWGAPYITVAIEKGLVNGYLDGTFRPDSNVTLEEAVTIALRLLGYTSADFKGSYPASQLEKYYELELNKGIDASKGEILTREECMILLYNMLSTKNKNGAVYCTTLGCAANSNGKLDYGALIEEKLDGPTILADVNGLTSIIDFTVNELTDYHLNNSPASKDDLRNNDVIYWSDKINSIFAFRKTATGIVSSYTANETVTLSNGKAYKVDTDSAKLKLSIGGEFNEKNSFVTLILGLNETVIDVVKGDISRIDENSDNASYISMIDATISSPIYLDNKASLNNWNKLIEIDTEKAVYHINGKQTTEYKPAVSDVLYYSKPFNSIWVYRETKSGTISAITPTAITVGHENYTLATDGAKLKVSTYGEYKVDSYVSLILGKNDEVIDILGDSKVTGVNDATIASTISLPVYIRNEETLNNIHSLIPFDISDAKIYLDGKETSSAQFEVLDVLYYSKPYSGIWIFRETASGVIKSSNNDTLTIGTSTYVLGTTEAKNKVSSYGVYKKNDYVTVILGKDDEIIDIIDASTTDIGKNENDSSYSEVVTGSLKGPYIVTKDGNADKLTIELESAKIFYLNYEIKHTEIMPYDVYYFSPVLNTVWIYRDTVSGTIDEITPSAAPTTVTVSGKTFAIEDSQASYDLSSFGSFGVGDKVTLLLGMEDKVAGVVSVDTLSKIYYGVVTGRGTKNFTEKDGDIYTADYVTVTDLNCNSYTYEHSKRTLGIGDIVRVSVGETVKISEQSTNIGRSVLASVINAINNKKFADDCRIIEIYDSKVSRVHSSRLDGVKLDLEAFLYSSTVLYCKFDEDNNLSELILNNFTGDLCEYGIVTSANTAQISYMTDNTKKTFAVTGIGCSEGAALIYSTDGVVTSIRNLQGKVENLDLVTSNAVYDTSDKEYLLSEQIKVFSFNAGSYKYISLEEAINGNYSYEAYYDKLPEKGGRIRVIIATKLP